MKSLLFGLLALPLFSFAPLDASNEAYDCNHVTLSCGVQYDICNFNGTTEQLIAVIAANDNAVCGGTPLTPAPPEGEEGGTN